MRSRSIPPSNADIDILIPVLGRPQNVAAVLSSITTVTTHAHRVFFIASKGDDAEIAALRKAKANVLIYPHEPGRGDFAKKINWAFPQTDAPWVFQGADDLKFHPGWDVHALHLGEQRAVGVVGTNDLGNKLVMRGGHSTHTFIRRAYIERYGGTFDDTGLVFCELYDHQFCDNELVQTAIRRGQWAFCKRSIVEHMHPVWKKSEMDETYEKAFRETIPDTRLFTRRMRMGDREQRRQRLHEMRQDRAMRRRRR